MTGSPCGACKFLRRKCVRGCVFAPYFCHEQGATHFAAIHKVFGASNASKLLSNLPVKERSEAALTISYEAQARLQDPVYGCVSHIFALQHQVVNLQAQLTTLKQQASSINQAGLTHQNPSSANPKYGQKVNGKHSSSSPSSSSSSAAASYPQDVHSWLQSEYSSMIMPQFDPNSFINGATAGSMFFGTEEVDVSCLKQSSNNNNNHSNCSTAGSFDQDSAGWQEEDNGSFASYEGSSSMAYDQHENNNEYNYYQRWPYHNGTDMADDLHSVAFGHTPQHYYS